MISYTETFRGFENNQSITLCFSGDKSFFFAPREYVSYLASDIYENYINFAYYVRYCECKKRGIKNIPFKPLFIKENANGEYYYTDNINEVSFDDFYGKLINNTVMYSEDRFPVLFPLLSSNDELAKKAYDYFCELFPAPKPETIPPKNFVLTSNI